MTYGGMSLPSRERGLKFENLRVPTRNTAVAPLAGAWIEICEQIADLNEYSVAPLAGAWIEIGYSLFDWKSSLRRSPRGSVD